MKDSYRVIPDGTYAGMVSRKAGRYTTFDMGKCLAGLFHTGIGIGIGFFIWG